MTQIHRQSGPRKIAQDVPAQGRKGFSLLELLVALFILALALIPVAYFYSQTVRSVALQQERARALMLAQERMSQVKSLSYERLHANNDPPRDIMINYVDEGNDQEDFNWQTANEQYNPFHANIPAGPNPYPSGNALPPVFNFPLPYKQPNVNPASGEPDFLSFNPYDPRTHGYNTENPNQEYEPIGFYQGLQKEQSIRSSDPRRNPVVDLPRNRRDTRSGTEGREEDFSIFGRRTVIMDVLPSSNQRVEDDDSDNFGPSHPRDGEDTSSAASRAARPSTTRSGPLDKFAVKSEFGNRGKLVVVQVFWLRDQQATGYIPKDELHMVELKNFIPASNDTIEGEAFDYLELGTGQNLITTPTSP